MSYLEVFCNIYCVFIGNCVNGEIHLVGGWTKFDGRVEVCNRGIWGTICDDHVDSTEATVMCYQLGMHDRNIRKMICIIIFYVKLQKEKVGMTLPKCTKTRGVGYFIMRYHSYWLF